MQKIVLFKTNQNEQVDPETDPPESLTQTRDI